MPIGVQMDYLLSTVFIPDASTTIHSPIISADSITIGALNIEQSGELSISSGKKLKIKKLPTQNNSVINGEINSEGTIVLDSITMLIDVFGVVKSNGSISSNLQENGLIIESNAISTGSLFHTESNLKATVQRWISGQKFVVISPPVIDQDLQSFLYQQGNPISKNNTAQYFAMQEYDENIGWSAYFPFTKTGTLEAGKAYSIRVGTSNGAVLTFKGTLHNGELTKNITRTSYGWNGIGNPYTSAINIKNGINSFLNTNASSLDPNYAGIWVFDPTINGYQILNNIPGSGPDSLAMAQGFIIKSKTGGASITFNNSMRNDGNPVFYKSLNESLPWYSFVLKINNTTLAASTKFSLNNNMTPSLDITYDAGMFKPNETFMLYSKMPDTSNTTNLSLQALPIEDFTEQIIPIGVANSAGGNVSFSIADIKIPHYLSIILEDTKLKQSIELNYNNYDAIIDPLDPQTGRFYLHIKDSRESVVITYSSENAGGSMLAELNFELLESGKRIESGNDIFFKATPELGVIIDKWIVNGKDSINSSAQLIITNISQDIDVKVVYKNIETGEEIPSNNEIFVYTKNDYIYVIGLDESTLMQLSNISGQVLYYGYPEQIEPAMINKANFKIGVYILTLVKNNKLFYKKIYLN